MVGRYIYTDLASWFKVDELDCVEKNRAQILDALGAKHQ